MCEGECEGLSGFYTPLEGVIECICSNTAVIFRLNLVAIQKYKTVTQPAMTHSLIPSADLMPY